MDTFKHVTGEINGNHEKPVRIVAVLAEIRTGYLPNTNLVRCHYTSLLDKFADGKHLNKITDLIKLLYCNYFV